jgi:PilZ domain
MFCSFRVTEMTTSRRNTRRWKRYQVELPVRILPCSRLPAIAVTGLGTGFNQGGMALHIGVDMEPDDLIEVEFPTSHPLKVMATVRYRSGNYFGLEFLVKWK